MQDENAITEPVKIFVINLKRSVDRKKEISKKLNEYSIKFEFYEAIDGTLLSDDFIKACRAKSNNWYQEDEGPDSSMKIGEIGAALSHYYIYKKIIEENIDFALILEDDADFDQRLKRFLSNVSKVKHLMEKFDLLLLGYCGHDTDFFKPATCSYWGRIYAGNLFNAGVPIKWCWSAIGYIISKKGANLLSKKQTPIPCVTADILTANSPQYGVKLGVLRKQIIWPGELNKFSTIRSNTLNPINNVSSKLVIGEEKNNKFSIEIKDFYRTLRFFLLNEKQKLDHKLYPFKTSRY